MPDVILDYLLTTLDVAVEAFAICEVRRGRRLVAGASDSIEVHYVLSGTMHLAVEGHPPITCGAGSVVLIPPGRTQVMAADDGPARDVDAAENCTTTSQGMMVFDAAEGGPGDLRVMCGLVMASVSGSFGLLDSVTRPMVENLVDVGMVRHAFDQMLAEIAAPELGSRALAGALMKACMVMQLRRHFSRSGHGAGVLGGLRDPRLGRAIAAVLDRPAEAHSVSSLASVAGMSRSVFAREFTAHLEMSPMAFVARTRLHQGAELLRSTRLPVKAIAATIGFASRSHFSRAFSSTYGTDPSDFRRTAIGTAPSGAKEKPTMLVGEEP